MIFLLQTGLENQVELNQNNTSIWFWAAILELIIIIFITLKLFNSRRNLADQTPTKNKLKEARNAEVDMDNLMNSINQSKELYKQLSRKCHPDLFVNDDNLKNKADILFQKISESKRDYKRLNELKIQAINELNIKLN